MKVMKLTEVVIDLLVVHVEEYEYPTRKYSKFLFKKDSFEMLEEVKIDFGLMLFECREKILQLPEFIECGKYMVENQTIRRNFRVTDKEGKPVDKVPLSIVLMSSLRPLLVTYLNKVGSLIFDERIFNEVYSEFEKYFYTNVEKYSVTSPLEKFSCDTNKIDLGKGLRIRRIYDEEKSGYLRLRADSLIPVSFGELNILNITHVLETIYSHRKKTPIDISSCRRDFEDIVTVLRLFKSGSVDFSVVRKAPLSWQTGLGTSYGSQGRYTSPQGPKYTLAESEVKQFKRIWKKYRKFRMERAKLKANKYLEIALRRFNLGVEESDFENKMIDYVISLEALYLRERRELKYRLSNRVAILIRTEEKEVEKIRRIIGKAYDLRSDIVHGAEIEPIKIDEKTIKPRDFASEVEEYLRRSIRSFIILSKTYKNRQTILEKLDKSLFNITLRGKLHRLTRFA